MSRLGALFLLLALVLWPAASASAKATLTTRIDRTEIAADEHVRLQVVVETNLDDGANPGELTAPPLDDWNVVQQMQQQSFVNRSSSQILTLIMRPQRTGVLQIGPFALTADGRTQKSKPITVKVTGQARGVRSGPPPGQGFGAAPPDQPAPPDVGAIDGLARAPDRSAFLRWEVDKRSAWLGEQVHAVLVLYVNRSLAIAAHDFGSINIEGFWSEALPQARPENELVVVGGERFVRSPVATYRLFPLRAGAAALPAVRADLTLADRSLFGGRRQRAKREAEPLTVEVRALPTLGQPAGFSGPAVGRLEVKATVDRSRVQAENGVQLTVTTTVQGLIGQVPEPSLNAPEWHAYPGAHDTRTTNQGHLVVGTRISRLLLKPRKTGRLTIPALEVPYFDPGPGTYAVARTQPIEVEVFGPLAASERPATPSAAAAPSGARPPALASVPGGGDAVPTLRGLRRQSDLGPTHGPAWTHPAFPALVFFPPLGWLALLGRDFLRARAAAGAGDRATRRAAAEARKAISSLGGQPPREAYAALSRILLEFLETRLHASVRGLTRITLRQRLEAAGLNDALAIEVADELENCEFARFSPDGDRDARLQEALRRAGELVGRIDAAAGYPA
ncbi:BatD family protein [Myxococcota bacterium]|nr:BatD family protein [Myxococcota bacterium]